MFRDDLQDLQSTCSLVTGQSCGVIEGSAIYVSHYPGDGVGSESVPVGSLPGASVILDDIEPGEDTAQDHVLVTKDHGLRSGDHQCWFEIIKDPGFRSRDWEFSWVKIIMGSRFRSGDCQCWLFKIFVGEGFTLKEEEESEDKY